MMQKDLDQIREIVREELAYYFAKVDPAIDDDWWEANKTKIKDGPYKDRHDWLSTQRKPL